MAKQKLFTLIIILIVTILIVPRIFGFVGGILYALIEDLPQQYASRPTEKLLEEMDSLNWRIADVAYGILVDRKEPRAVPKIIDRIKKNERSAAMYVQALAIIGDKRAVPVLVELLKKYEKYGADNDIYYQSFSALSKFKYDPIWKDAIRLSDSKRASDMGLAIRAFENFGRMDAISYLEKLERRIKAKDYMVPDSSNKPNVEYYFPASDATNAIMAIKKSK